MFKLRTSNTSFNSAATFLLFGPGMAEDTVGPEGSLEKYGWAARNGVVLRVRAAGRRAKDRSLRPGRRADMMAEVQVG